VLILSALTWQVILLSVLLVLSAFFSSSETALFSLGRSREGEMERSDRASRRLAARLLKSPRTLLVSLLVGNTLVNVAAASLGTAVAINLLTPPGSGQAVGQGIIWATLIMTALILFAGEIAPKSFALENAEVYSSVIARPLSLFILLIKPVRIVLERANNVLLSLFHHPDLKGPGLSSDELATAVDVGHDTGIVDAFEREVINNIIELESRNVGDVMTPRIGVVSMDRNTPPDRWVETFRSSGYSRIPVVDGDLDRIDGIFYAKDYLAGQMETPARGELGDLLRNPYIVPESMKVLELLGEFRRRQLHFAMVIDEYGSVSGVVTMEDVLEEIVGEIADSRDAEDAPFKTIEPGVAVVFAGLELDEFSRATGVSIRDRHAETVGGWLTNRLGRIPETDETLRIGPFSIRILSASATRVLWLRVEWMES
jgi:CBS domain containing-hemolysin-like protein